MKKAGNKIKKLTFVVVFSLLFPVLPVYAQENSEAPAETPTPNIDEKEEISAEQKDFQEWLAKQQNKETQIRRVQSAEEVLELEISALESEIKSVEGELLKAEESIRNSERTISSQEEKIRSLEQRSEALRVLMRGRAIEMYMESGSQSLIDEFLSSSDGSSFEMRKVLVQFANEKTEGIVRELNKTKTEIAESKQKNVERLQQLQVQKQALSQRNDELGKKRAELDLRKSQLRNIGADILNEITLLQAEENVFLDILGYSRIPEGAPVFVNPPASASGLIWPAEGVLTSNFGMRWGALHQGIDIGAPTGTPIYAANSGRVIFSGVQGGYGKIVILDHGEGFHTAYAHQSRLLVVPGDTVIRGQMIGLVGSTGHSTGPHLHFETRVNGTPVNPLILLNQ